MIDSVRKNISHLAQGQGTAAVQQGTGTQQ
uniref:Uncharacterized protein n=1 Tax=Anguilla anguilla TaxID=7936 RepID=A0A0E9XUP1_ANGAN